MSLLDGKEDRDPLNLEAKSTTSICLERLDSSSNKYIVQTKLHYQTTVILANILAFCGKKN